MRLKNIVIVVDDIDEAVDFYTKIMGLQVIMKQEGNVILSDGLVLQDAAVWSDEIGMPSVAKNNASILYFEDPDIEELDKNLEDSEFIFEMVDELTTLPWGQKLLRFYDPWGNMIEVRTPKDCISV